MGDARKTVQSNSSTRVDQLWLQKRRPKNLSIRSGLATLFVAALLALSPTGVRPALAAVSEPTVASALDTSAVLTSTAEAEVTALSDATFAPTASHADALSSDAQASQNEKSHTVLAAAPAEAQDPAENIARGMQVVADSVEAPSLPASKAVDGDTSSRSSRWSSVVDASQNRNGGPHWIAIDFGKERSIKTVRIFWEMRKAKGYRIQIATGDQMPAADSAAWQTVYENPSHPSALRDMIRLNQVATGRYLRLYVDENTYADPDGGVAWGNISLFEIEAYGGEPPVSETLEDVAAAISLTTPGPTDTKLNIQLPQSQRFMATYNGTDYEQVIGDDLTIYKPIVDTQVVVSFKVVEKENPGNMIFREIPVTVPGSHTVEAEDNPAPKIIPELREWKGGSGVFSICPTSRILYADPAYKHAADELANDYSDLFGTQLEVVAGSDAQAGDILLTPAGTDHNELGNEGYYMEVGDAVTVRAGGPQGAYWSTRTVLQALVGSNTKSIPQGTARDYPLYRVRGLILDVGRKTFTLDFLKQLSRELAWYKLNDLQVHLNDNYIWVEEYTDDKVDEAYSGFRLESDIKAGGDSGRNKADLTSKDVWYSKKDFRDFITQARAIGVNVVPEFDTPAHSLAFTKVRPDLRTPRSMTHRGNDHLNIATKYDESLSFVKSVWDEYISGENPVFDEQTTLHIGADEFEADGDAYRRFVNDLFAHIEATGRTTRIWGSLSHIRGSGNVAVQGTSASGKLREINLWNGTWADMKEMYKLGFGLINSNDGTYYMVPNATYYGDYLNPATVYNSAINTIGRTTIPAGDKQMLGGSFAVWNDMTGRRENGMSEYDIYDRIRHSAAYYAAASWGKTSLPLNALTERAAQLGDAPNTNFGYKVKKDQSGVIAHYKMNNLSDSSGMVEDLTLDGGAQLVTVDGRNALKLVTGSVVQTGLDTVGLGNNLRVKVKRTNASTDEQILFESAYGAIKAIQSGTGKVGFSREGRDYSFNYKLPVGEWVELEFKNIKDFTTLYVNGTKVETLGQNGRGKLKATSMLPLKQIGSKTHGFEGFIDDVRVSSDAAFSSTMKLDAALQKARAVLTETNDPELLRLVQEAAPLVEEMNPEGEAIQTALSALSKRLSELSFKKANYEQVDALLAAVPKDLSRFSAESVHELNEAIQVIERDLPAAMQEQVEVYRTRLSRALKALTPKPADEMVASVVSATASSEETAQENTPASAAFDGDPNTIWHTRWSSQPDQGPTYWIEAKLQEPSSVTGMVYVPRSDGENGRLEQYRVEVSTNNGASYKSVAEGAVSNPARPTTISFDAVDDVTHVKLVFTKSKPGNRFASAAEIQIQVDESKKDIQRLQEALKQAKSLAEKSYTPASWAKLAESREAAQAIVQAASPAAADVTHALTSLLNAMLQLDAVEIKDPVPPAPDPHDTPGTENPDPGTEQPNPGTENPNPGTETPSVKEYSVQFVVDGVVNATIQVKEGELAPRPQDPVKPGYTFMYWATPKAVQVGVHTQGARLLISAPLNLLGIQTLEAYDFSLPVTKDLVLTAVFKKNEEPLSGKHNEHVQKKDSKKQGLGKPATKLPKTSDGIGVAATALFSAVGVLTTGVLTSRRRRK
ncbi:discoidin domain-containing protein [Collinsella sp. AGMB00827]|uniref:Discoidin domain-containing protein n=1 Tax=Collinsella ureilytica TaxID=2869515 RepID=A0ABS7MKB5_9ACTN|nr:discoidin domain-containing protein [Collinsella urealyticum]MBY4797821.1 discoidin domain-containing protein [Collinsella urealyticum]